MSREHDKRLAVIAHFKAKAKICREMAERSFDQRRQKLWLDMELFWLKKTQAAEDVAARIVQKMHRT